MSIKLCSKSDVHGPRLRHLIDRQVADVPLTDSRSKTKNVKIKYVHQNG